MAVLYTNNATTSLSSGISSSATSIVVGSVANLPSLSGGEYYFATLANVTNTKIEIVKITAASGTTLTVVRAQDNTAAVTFDSGDNLQLRVTAATLDSATRTDVAITGGSIDGSVIDSNTIGADALNVTGNGTTGQYLGSDADGTMTWTSISADPTMGGDLSGTASNAQIVANAVTDTELNSAKLNGIETGATADQTNAQIKTAYEANANSNEFSDAEQTKLSGVATSANNYSLPSSVVHDTEKGSLHATDALRLSGNTVSLYKGDGTSESVTIPDNNTTYSVGDNGLTQKNFTSADNTKLDGIETGATADQTQSDINALGITATSVDLGNWTITESSGVMYFATGGTNKAKLDASGNFTVVGDVTAFGTI